MTGIEHTRSNKDSLSVVTSVLNEEDSVQELVDRTLGALKESGHPHELIIVNDGSTDATLPLLLKLSEKYAELRIIDLLRNFGVMAAVTAGVSVAKGAAVIVLDGDLQAPPELIPQLAEKWREGADIVICRRKSRQEGPLLQFMIKIYYTIYRQLNEHAQGDNSGNFGLMDREVADIMIQLPERERYFAGLRDWIGGRRAVVEYDRLARKFGESRQGLFGLLRHARSGVVSFSVRPLRLISGLSLIVASVMLLIGLVAITVRITTDIAVPGWATYVTLFSILGFMQALSFAVLAEYISVLFIEAKGRTIFAIRDEYKSGASVPLEYDRAK